MKKEYISPALKVRTLKIKYQLLAGSGLKLGMSGDADNTKTSTDGTGHNDAKSDVGFIGFGE